MEPDVYRLLDVHQLLIAQSQIYELTTQMLQEQTRSHTIQTEKMASLGRMVAGIAHEIKNPVNCISGNMGFLSNYCQDLLELVSVYEQEVETPSPRIVETIENIDLEFLRNDLPKLVQSLVVSSDRLTKIVGGLQNFSHLDETSRKPADLHECLDSTLLILNNQIKYDIKLVKNYGDLPLVDCYSGQLSQVFMNLLGNAIDALLERKEKESGNLNKNQAWTPQLAIATELINREDQSAVIIRIADNGMGIPTQIQQRIFDTFFTTKPVGKGTGLGLAISNEIVRDKHKGQLNLNSQEGVGTEFEIILPLDRKPEIELRLDKE
jgi:signal transduction histidine kinase